MSALQPIQVDPLPLSSGGKLTQTQKEMEKTNETLTMLAAQSTADTMYDPPVPSTITKPSIREAFSQVDPSDYSEYLFIVGIVFIVYGILSK